MFDSDFDALEFLSAYGIYQVKNGILRIYHSGATPKTTIEWNYPLEVDVAIRYLQEEWDFDIEWVY